MRFLHLVLALLSVSHAATLPTASRMITWTPGTTVGVPGGVAQYLDQSGSGNQRNTADGLNAVSGYSADNTGASDTLTEIKDALDAAGTDQVVYFPAGLYKHSNAVVPTSVFKSNFTLRGAGPAVYSTTSNTIGTGSKTFTVPAGKSWTNGCGILIWSDDPDDPTTYENFLIGTVTSYSGTTLVTNITSSNGSGTFSRWLVGQTVFYNTTNGKGFQIGSGDYEYSNWGDVTTTITSSPVKGATSFTVASATGLATGNVLIIKLANMEDATEIAGGEIPVLGTGGEPFVRRQMVRITNVSGTTVTVEPALAFDLPVARTPSFYKLSNLVSEVGVENCTFFGGDVGVGDIGHITQGYACWVYGVDMLRTRNYTMEIDVSLMCEVRKSFIGHRTAGGSNGAGMLLGNYSSFNLIEDNIICYNYPVIEINAGVTGNVFSHNYTFGETLTDVSIVLTHSTHPSFVLHEGNCYFFSKEDGYFGSSSNYTFLRNWIYGGGDFGLYGAAAANRLTRNHNLVGNLMGTPSVADGIITSLAFGYPNISNQSYTGTATPSASDPWKDLGITGTLTTRTSDTVATFTLNKLGQISTASEGDLAPSQSTAINVYWNGGNRKLVKATDIDAGTVTVVLENTDYTTGSVWPAESTAVTLYTGVSGWQEYDNDVETSFQIEGNYVVTGAGGSQQSLGGNTVIDSALYGSKPAFFGTLTWPAFNPASPMFDATRIPAGYRYLNMNEDYLTGGSTTLTTTTLNVTTIVVP
jgi:hypothetical protein